ncbi:MAG: endonuclease domain-containing protein [Pseudolabrys sp.]
MPHSAITKRTRGQARALRKTPDGSQHAEAQLAYDIKRTAWLESQGYRVLRFWNNDVLKPPRGVGEAILAAAQKNPTPNPSPQGGGEHAAASGEDVP